MPCNATLLIIVSIIIVSRVPRTVFFHTLTIVTVSHPELRLLVFSSVKKLS